MTTQCRIITFETGGFSRLYRYLAQKSELCVAIQSRVYLNARVFLYALPFKYKKTVIEKNRPNNNQHMLL